MLDGGRSIGKGATTLSVLETKRQNGRLAGEPTPESLHRNQAGLRSLDGSKSPRAIQALVIYFPF